MSDTEIKRAALGLTRAGDGRVGQEFRSPRRDPLCGDVALGSNGCVGPCQQVTVPIEAVAVECDGLRHCYLHE